MYKRQVIERAKEIAAELEESDITANTKNIGKKHTEEVEPVQILSLIHIEMCIRDRVMAGQTEFLQAIQELERLGETNGNQLSMEEINSYFSDMKLEEKQLDFICNYFESHHIYITNRVQRFEEEIGDEEIPNKEDPMDAEIVACLLYTSRCV